MPPILTRLVGNLILLFTHNCIHSLFTHLHPFLWKPGQCFAPVIIGPYDQLQGSCPLLICPIPPGSLQAFHSPTGFPQGFPFPLVPTGLSPHPTPQGPADLRLDFLHSKGPTPFSSLTFWRALKSSAMLNWITSFHSHAAWFWKQQPSSRAP